MGLLSFLKGLFTKKKPKIGLCLGSGGAKGAGHLGVLKAFEEENIKFDMVSGASIGSIVGGMYALNYDVKDMIRIFETFNFTDKISLLKMTLKKEPLESLLEGIFGDKTFSDTRLPFRAVACDINSGEEVVMGTGLLYKATAASSAIPPIFRPVHRMGRKLVDGAFINAVPADAVKSLGADVVISISLHDEPSNEKIKRYADLLYKGNQIPLGDRFKGLKDSDYTLFLPLEDFTSASIKDFNEMFDIGYNTAKAHMDEIKKLLNGGK